MKDIQGFIDWVKEKPGKRQVEIKVGGYKDAEHFKAWVYDYDLLRGQYVTDASEIKLEQVVAEEEKAEYEKLKKKFEGEK